MAHCPGFAILAGESLRYVAEQGGRWLALRGWGAVAFKCGPRDAWIVWSKSQQLRRCRCVANNLRRLFGDWQPILGHPIALAKIETPGPPHRGRSHLSKAVAYWLGIRVGADGGRCGCAGDRGPNARKGVVTMAGSSRIRMCGPVFGRAARQPR